jgi:hypothetical protein
MSLEALNEDFRDILILFADGEVEFLLVGAYALALHGAPRASGDIDLFVRPSSENAAKVYSQLVRFGAPVSALGITADDLAKPGVVYQLGLPPRRIDVLTEISGLSFDDAWQTRETATLEGRSIPFIGRDAFIRNKEAAGRPKDLADASRLKGPKAPGRS